MTDNTEALPPLRGDGFWEERMKTIQAECGAPDTPEVWHALWRVRDELERWAIRYARESVSAALAAAPPAQQQSQPPRSIIITLRQARELVELFGGADSEVVVTKREAGEIQPDRREDRGLCPEDGLSSHAQGTGSRSSDRP